MSPDFRFLEVGISAKVSLHVIKSAVKCDRTFYLLLVPYQSNSHDICIIILGDPGANKGGEGKSKRVEKYIWNEEK